MTMRNLTRWSSALALCATASLASAQTQKEVEPVVPVGPPVAPVAEVPIGPAVQPVIPVERLQGVDTVTLDTPRGPVVVVSWPTSVGGTDLSPENNLDFGGVDANGDNQLTKTELRSAKSESPAAGRLESRFDAMDVNNDDRLDTQEVLVWVHR